MAAFFRDHNVEPSLYFSLYQLDFLFDPIAEFSVLISLNEKILSLPFFTHPHVGAQVP